MLRARGALTVVCVCLAAVRGTAEQGAAPPPLAFEVASGPSWIDGDRFDVQARTSDDAPPNQMPAMLEALLAERFGLVAHTETRDGPVYALEAAAASRRPALKASTRGQDCRMNISGAGGGRLIKAVGCTIPDIAQWLSDVVERPVRDQSALGGRFDLEFAFSSGDAAVTPGSTPGDAPSIVTALPEQLGLRLRAERGPVELLVVDRMTRPTTD